VNPDEPARIPSERCFPKLRHSRAAGRVAASADEAVAAAQAIGGPVWVVKAQVHAGGRGKAGGVKVARNLDTVRAAAKGMLGKPLVTKQTGPEGLPVGSVYVESGSDIDREIYLSLTLLAAAVPGKC
jgi:succinyl-CoA synthetase beta subunit